MTPPTNRSVLPGDLAGFRTMMDSRYGAYANPMRTDGQRLFPKSKIVVESGYTHGEVWVVVKTNGTFGLTKKFHAGTLLALTEAISFIGEQLELERVS